MKKLSIFFSFLLLSLTFMAANANALCRGATVSVCIDRPPTPAGCTGNASASTGATGPDGCVWTAGVGDSAATCTGTPNPSTCAAITDRGICGITTNNCDWIISGDTNNTAFTQTICNALKIVTGTGGKAFAAFAVIVAGIGFFSGKISWGLLIGVTCGIGALFGAPTIVAAISGGDAVDCSA